MAMVGDGVGDSGGARWSWWGMGQVDVVGMGQVQVVMVGMGQVQIGGPGGGWVRCRWSWWEWGQVVMAWASSPVWQ